ncbi:MAG: potassium channel family protein [Candidatus Sulfobium sp.]|jgi:hypothetical protein
MKSFVVQFWKGIFNTFRWVSVFHILRQIIPEMKSSGWVDLWVLFNFVLSFACLFFLVNIASNWLLVILIAWGAVRVFEIIVYQATVLLFDPYEQKKSAPPYALRGYRRLLILIIQNYIEIAAWFGSFYIVGRTYFIDNNCVLKSSAGALYYSIVTMTTLGYGDVTPNSAWTRLLVSAQALTGVFMVAVIVARFISFLPKPQTLDDSEKE